MKSDEQFLHERVSGEITFLIMGERQTFTEDDFKALMRGVIQLTKSPMRGDDFDVWLSDEIQKIRQMPCIKDSSFNEGALLKAVETACEYPAAVRYENMDDIKQAVFGILGCAEYGWTSFAP